MKGVRPDKAGVGRVRYDIYASIARRWPCPA